MVDTLQLAKTLQRDFTPAQADAPVAAFSQQMVEELATFIATAGLTITLIKTIH